MKVSDFLHCMKAHNGLYEDILLDDQRETSTCRANALESGTHGALRRYDSLKHNRPPSAIGFSLFTRRLGRSLEYSQDSKYPTN